MDEERFIALALSNPINSAILARLPSLALPDAWLVSGSLFQAAWNHLTRRAPTYGIKDYDIFYFDPDPSWDAEDAVIRRCADVFADLGVTVEVRNQARVHLWYREKFGISYPPVTRSSDAIDRFLSRASTIGVSATPDGLRAYAPHGFDDIEAMVVRPNRSANFQAHRYAEKAARWKQCWPEITVVPA